MFGEHPQHRRRPDLAIGGDPGGRRRRPSAQIGAPPRWRAPVARHRGDPFDTISVCFSKALGAPVGSCLLGTKDFVARARRFKQQFGGGFRQAGIIAAGALYAVQNHRTRLRDIHALASRFAQGLAQIDGVEIDPTTVETNVVRYRLTKVAAGRFVDEAHRRGLWMLPSGPDAVRAVFYLDIVPSDVDDALKIIADALRSLPQQDGSMSQKSLGAASSANY